MFRYEFSKDLKKKVWYIPEKLKRTNIGTLSKFYHYKDTHKRSLFDKMKQIIKIRTGGKFDAVWKEFEQYANERKSDTFIFSKLLKYKECLQHHDVIDTVKKIKITGEVYLDIGCADGKLTMLAANHFKVKKVYGVDIKQLKTKRFTFLGTDTSKINLDDNSVDIVSMFNTFHYIHDMSVISEIKRILKPDGSFIIYDSNVDEEFSDLMVVLHNFIDSTKVIYRSLSQINSIVNMQQCEEIKIPGAEGLFIKRWTPKLKHFRTLTEKIPRLKYKRRSKDVKNVIHWGQRKLLMTEIEFLTKFYRIFSPTKKVYMIYAGAAAGTHLLLLKELFPHIYLELYDSNPFDKRIKTLNNTNSHNRYFYDSDAEYWNSTKHPDKHILLVSDIRTADVETMSSEEVEKCVKNDHKMQKGWYDLMEPEYSMFKFRLPWEDGNTEYMRGQIYIQPWAPVTSTETRLIVQKDAELVLYDNRDYEERLFHYNIYEREKEYANIFENLTKEEKNGLDNRYDSVAEINILRRCLKDQCKILPFSKKITLLIGKRNLFDSNPLRKGITLITSMKKIGIVPQDAPLTQGTYNKYVIPNWNKLVKMKLVDHIPDDDLFVR